MYKFTRTQVAQVAAKFGVSLAVAASMIANASAALDSGISTGLTAIQTDAASIATLVWPVLLAIMGSLVVMKLVKKYVAKL